MAHKSCLLKWIHCVSSEQPQQNQTREDILWDGTGNTVYQGSEDCTGGKESAQLGAQWSLLWSPGPMPGNAGLTDNRNDGIPIE